MSEFVPASQLYDVESRTPIAHPAHQATDGEVQRALEDREIRADGGQSSSGTVQKTTSQVHPQLLHSYDRFTSVSTTSQLVTSTPSFRHSKQTLAKVVVNRYSATIVGLPNWFGSECSLQTRTERRAPFNFKYRT